MRKAKISLSAVAVGALVAAGFATAPQATAQPRRHTIAHTAPRWVAHTRSLGAAPAKGTSAFRVYLAPNGGTDSLKAAVAAVSSPGSSTYRHFLSASQYHRRFDATSATVKSVSGWLSANNLTVTSVEAHHRYLSVKGTNASVQKALGTTIKTFTRRGKKVQANTTAVSLPTDIASSVLTVTGLDTSPTFVKHDAKRETAPPSAGFRNARPCSHYYGQIAAKYEGDFKTKLPKFDGDTLPYSVCGYTGQQLRGAYEGTNPTGLSGKGVTVAITDAFASPTLPGDTATYSNRHGDGSYAKGQLKQVTPNAYRYEDECGASGWYGEETLDVEAVHAMAPDANVIYYAGKSCENGDLSDALAKVVNQNKASLVTNSWGSAGEDTSADEVAADEQIFMQGALQGIGFLFSSGDSGDELASTGIRQPDYPASDPYVTAVGGTSDAIGANGTFLFQTGWGTEKYTENANHKGWTNIGFTSGAGGGESSLFARPAYQKGVVPSSFGAGRAVPDVGLDADPTTGFLVGQTQTFNDGVYYDEYRIGGTSVASPLYAGMTALTAQNAGGRLGFLNPAIYQQAGSKTFSDVKGSPPDEGNVRADFVNSTDESDGIVYSVRAFGRDSSLALGAGWDEVTGVGSPRAGWITSIKK